MILFIKRKLDEQISFAQKIQTIPYSKKATQIKFQTTLYKGDCKTRKLIKSNFYYK
jgi:hypothetical protein